MTSLIIIDTNILVSALLSPYGNPSIILRLILSQSLQIVLDSRVFHEYETVLARPKFQFEKEDIESLISFMKLEGIWVNPKPFLQVVDDPFDLPFIELSIHTHAPIITGNTKHFQGDLTVFTPTDFLNMYKMKE